eukprot:1022522-Pyramimonas_sp.AAC.1
MSFPGGVGAAATEHVPDVLAQAPARGTFVACRGCGLGPSSLDGAGGFFVDLREDGGSEALACGDSRQ